MGDAVNIAGFRAFSCKTHSAIIYSVYLWIFGAGYFFNRRRIIFIDKSTQEIYAEMEPQRQNTNIVPKYTSFALVITKSHY